MIDIDVLDHAVQDKRFADAGMCFRELMQGLTAQGHLPLSDIVLSTQDAQADDDVLAQRLASSLHALFVAPDSDISVPDYDALMSWQIVLSQIFYLAGQSSADAAMKDLLAQSNGQVSSGMTMKLFLLFGTESAMAAHLYPFMKQNPELLLNTCMTHVWGCSGTQQRARTANGLMRKFRACLRLCQRRITRCSKSTATSCTAAMVLRVINTP